MNIFYFNNIRPEVTRLTKRSGTRKTKGEFYSKERKIISQTSQLMYNEEIPTISEIVFVKIVHCKINGE